MPLQTDQKLHRAEAFLRSSQLCSHSETFLTFYGTRRVITVFTRAIHRPLTRFRSIQTTPSQTEIHTNIIHPPTYWSSWWSRSFWLSYNNLYAFLFSPCHVHCILLDFIIVERRGLLQTHTHTVSWNRRSRWELRVVAWSSEQNAVHVTYSNLRNVGTSLLQRRCQ
jgi:hypothetical protein